MKMKKNMARLLSLFLIPAVLVGCGAQPAGPSPSGTAPAAPQSPAGTTEPVKDPYEPIEGKKYHILWTANQTAPIAENPEIVQIFNEKFNVEIEVLNIESGKAEEIMGLKFAAGEIPDKFGSTVNTMPKYYTQGVMAEIPQEVLNKYAPNVVSHLESDQAGVLEYGKYEGNLYGIPQEIRLHNIYRAPLVYRGDWMKNLGVEKSPETLAEFESLMYRFAKDDPDRNGKNDTYGLSDTSMTAVYGAFGYIPGNWMEKDGQLVYGAVQPEMKEALTLLNKWFKDGVIDPEFITGENTGGHASLTHKFINGVIGTSSMSFYYQWQPMLREGGPVGRNYAELEKLNPEAVQSLVFGLPPVGPTGKRGINQGQTFTGAFSSFGVQLEKEPDKLGIILQMMDWVASDYENYLTGYYGEKGKNWEYNEIKQPIVIREEAKDTNWLNSQGGHTIMVAFTPLEYSKIVSVDRVEWATKNQFDIGGMQNELIVALQSDGKFKAELQKIVDEAYISIITGDKPVDYFDEFVAKWKKSGGDQLTQEANEWYRQK